MNNSNKPFGLWSATFLGLGTMVGAGIFVLLGEAGAIAGNLVWASFIFGGVIALLSGYSLAKLAVRYPSRGGLVEYLVECYGEGVFSGSLSVLSYLSAIVSIAMVAKAFGVYASVITGDKTSLWTDIYAISVLLLFMFVNLLGSSLVAKSENVIVIIKLSIILFVTIAIFPYIKPALLSLHDAPPLMNVFSSVALTFFAYEGFRVITNTAEDMDNPAKNMLKSMTLAILLSMALYVSVSFAVFGNISLTEIIKAQDYALAQAAKPSLGEMGFTLVLVAALISTASAINASLYAVSNITYQMAKNGELPKVYERNIWHSSEGLIVSTVLLILFVLFLNLNEIAAVGSISILFVHGFVHIGHLFKINQTKASKILVFMAIISIGTAITLALQYTSKHIPDVGYMVAGGFVIAFTIEIGLRLVNKRVVQKQYKG